MKRFIVTALGVMIVISITLWISGVIGFVVAPWLPSAKAELIGEIMFTAASVGELGVYFFGWSRYQADDRTGAEGIDKYRLF